MDEREYIEHVQRKTVSGGITWAVTGENSRKLYEKIDNGKLTTEFVAEVQVDRKISGDGTLYLLTARPDPSISSDDVSQLRILGDYLFSEGAEKAGHVKRPSSV